MRFSTSCCMAVLLAWSSSQVFLLVDAFAPQQQQSSFCRSTLVASNNKNGHMLFVAQEEEIASSSSFSELTNDTSDDNVSTTPPLSTEEEEFLQETERLCEERNLPLEKVKNARDLASACNSDIKIQPGRVYRMGRVSDASEKDIELLFQDINIKTLVDLRSPTELKDDPTLERSEVFGDFTSLVWSERGRGKDGCLRELAEGESPIHKHRRNWFGSNNNNKVVMEDDCDVCADGSVPTSQKTFVPFRKERHFVSLMNEFKYVKGTLSKLRKRDIARTVLKSPGALVSKRVRSNIKKPFLEEINDGGLPMLNELLARFGAPGIKYVLDLVADKSRHPIAFYCTAGKDRTGMIAAIILALADVPQQDIVQDYTLSANVYAEMNDHKAMVGALSQRNLDPKTFLCAPPQVMRDTLQAIEEDYGSIEGYCDWIGFTAKDRKRLRDALLLKE